MTPGGKRGGLAGTALLVAAMFLSDAAAADVTADPFDEMLKVCAANKPEGIAAAMSALHATELSQDRIDLLQLSMAVSFAIPMLLREPGAKSIAPILHYEGWELGRATLLLAAEPGKPMNQGCRISAPYDRSDAAIAALTADLGPPIKETRFNNVRAVAWGTHEPDLPPDVLLVTADFGGDRKPTLIQFVRQ